MSEKEMLKQTNKLLEGLKMADYQLLKQKSMLNQNIITEDDNGNKIVSGISYYGMPARTVFQELYQEKLSVCLIED